MASLYPSDKLPDVRAESLAASYNRILLTLSFFQFSFAGCYASERPIPSSAWPVAEVLSPLADERTDRTSDIQSALDRASAAATPGRGAVVLLKTGKYALDSRNSLRFARSNVALRGEARGATFLRVRGPKRPIVVFGLDEAPNPLITVWFLIPTSNISLFI
jgi:hypothetical protein